MLYCEAIMTLQRRPGGQPAIPQYERAIAPTRDTIARVSRGVALAGGSLSLAGAGADSIANVLPYASPQQWMLVGLALIALSAGRRIPNLFGK